MTISIHRPNKPSSILSLISLLMNNIYADSFYDHDGQQGQEQCQREIDEQIAISLKQ